jgi:hypothetical protein
MGGGCQCISYGQGLGRGLALGGRKPLVCKVLVFSFLNKIFLLLSSRFHGTGQRTPVRSHKGKQVISVEKCSRGARG